MIVNVGSKNAFKVEAIREAFRKMDIYAEVCGFETNSLVSAQPIGDETFVGARNRALAVRSDKADFTIGIESGIVKREGKCLDFAVVHVIDKKGMENFATTSYFVLPEKVVELLDQKYELSDAIDMVYNLKNSKSTKSAVGVLSGGAITLKDILVPAAILAMYPFQKRKE